MKSVFQRTAAALMLALLIAPAAFAIDSDDGGITFPLVASFVETDGTRYATVVSIYPESPIYRFFPESSPLPAQPEVYLRFQWMPLHGEAFDYPSPWNPLSGAASFNVTYIGLLAGKQITGAGALRVSPTDSTGKPLANVRLAGFARITIERPNGAFVSERAQGIPDIRLPGLRAHNVTPMNVTDAQSDEVRMVWLTNLTSQQRTYFVTWGTEYFPDDTFRSTSWKEEKFVDVPPYSTLAVPITDLPDYILKSKLFNPLNGSTRFRGSMFVTAACRTCADGEPFTAATTGIDRKTGDLRVILDVISDR